MKQIIGKIEYFNWLNLFGWNILIEFIFFIFLERICFFYLKVNHGNKLNKIGVLKSLYLNRIQK